MYNWFGAHEKQKEINITFFCKWTEYYFETLTTWAESPDLPAILVWIQTVLRAKNYLHAEQARSM